MTPGNTSPTGILTRAARLLADRLVMLEDRLQQGDEATWSVYVATVMALTSALPHLAPGARGELLTTAEMAARLQVSPRTLLRRKARGQVTPALQLGRRGRAAIRWAGDEAHRGNGGGNVLRK